jgi:hypothetical protein
MSKKGETQIKGSGNADLDNVGNSQVVNLIMIDYPLSTVMLFFTSLLSIINNQQNENGSNLPIDSLIQTLNNAIEEDKKSRNEMMKNIEKAIESLKK